MYIYIYILAKPLQVCGKRVRITSIAIKFACHMEITHKNTRKSDDRKENMQPLRCRIAFLCDLKRFER